MRIQLDVDGVTIVLVGSFNPRIFRPEWFVGSGILGAQEAAAAAIQIISENITAFSLDWLNLTVTTDRLIVEVTGPPLIRASDLVTKTFKEFLLHTPIYQMGINRIVHFRVGSYEIKDKMGERLAPKAPWGAWGAAITDRSEKLEKHGGMTSLSMRQVERDDGRKGIVNATVEPSARFPIDGIYMLVNDHYVLGTQDEILGSDQAVDVLQTSWDRSMERADWIIDQIMALKEAVQNV